MTDITGIIEAVVNLAALVIGVVLIPLIKEKLGESKLRQIVGWLEFACSAAEEAARCGLIDKSAKYDYAVSLLEKNGITFDAQTTRALIDSTVWKLFNSMKPQE